jgi:radical SAM superfamily enzyme YgiQ (UPF0313 family)
MLTPTRVLLIDPGTTREELNEPIGIGALAATLEAEVGPEVLVDLVYVPLDGPVEAARLGRYDIVGLSTPLGSLADANSVATVIDGIAAEHRPLFVIGGLLATFAPDELLTRFPDAVLVLGEGEDSLSGVVRALRGAGRNGLRAALERDRVPNLVFAGGDRIVRTPRTLVNLATALAPRRDYVPELVRRQGIVRAETSRGCAWGRCTFCAIQHKYADQIDWRKVRIERVVRELEEMSTGGARHPFFTDEDFIGGSPERAIELAGAIGAARKEGRIAADLTLYVDMRVDTILAAPASRPSGADVLRAMRAAGLREVFVGIESGAKEQVRRYQKPATAQRNLKALAMLRELGVAVDVGFILFDPEMSLPEVRANLAFLKEAGLWDHDARMTKALRVEAGTPLVADYRAKDLITGPLDVDELLWPYRWVDPRVEAVHEAFRAWEIERMGEVYAIQAATRGEVPSEQERRDRRRLLGEIRVVEHEALEALAIAAEERRDPARVDLARWARARGELIDRWGRRRAA